MRIFLSHPINLWRPPTSPSSSAPGLRARWYVFARIISLSRHGDSRVAVESPFIAPCVPTGIKTGVRSGPWPSTRVVARAFVVSHSAFTQNERGCRVSHLPISRVGEGGESGFGPDARGEATRSVSADADAMCVECEVSST